MNFFETITSDLYYRYCENAKSIIVNFGIVNFKQNKEIKWNNNIQKLPINSRISCNFYHQWLSCLTCTLKSIVSYLSGRRSGLMVSVLDSGASAPGLSPGRGRCVVFKVPVPGTGIVTRTRTRLHGKPIGQDTTLAVPLSPQVYKWVPANLMLGVTLCWTSIPSMRSRNTPSHFMIQKLG